MKNALFIFLVTLIAIVLIMFLAPLEPSIRSLFFSSLPEAEVQTYMFGIGLFVLFTSLLYIIFDKIRRPILPHHTSPIVVFSLFVAMDGALLIWGYTFFNSVRTSSGIQTLLGDIFIYQAASLTTWHFLLSTIISATCIYSLSRPMTGRESKGILWNCLVVAIVFWLTTGVNKLNLYDYANYAGPIQDHLLGKPLLTFRSQYGFIPIIFLTQIFRVLPLTGENLHIVVAVFQFLGFLLYYKLVLSVLKDRRWALIATIFTIFGKHLVSDGAAYLKPQQSLLRLGTWLIIALAMSDKGKRSTLWKNNSQFITTLLVSINVFWTQDFGLYTLLAYILFLFLNALESDMVKFLKSFTMQIIILFASIASIAVAISVYYKFRYGLFPMWTMHYFAGANYLGSSHMIPVPDVPALWIFILIPVITIGYLLSRKLTNGHLISGEQAMLFTAFVALTTFNYFLGRSTIGSLNALSTPVFFCLFYFIKKGIESLRHTQNPVKITGMVLVGLLLAIPGTVLGFQGLITLQSNNPISTYRVLHHENPETLNEYYWIGSTAEIIRSKYGNEIKPGNLTMLSVWATWFMVIFNTPNITGVNCQHCYIVDEKPFFQVDNIRHSPSPYLFVDSDRTIDNNNIGQLFDQIKSEYEYIETIGFLDVFKRI